ncbi:MAG: VirB4-like conjugal transfer ATPase, CD1110 family [Alkalibacterium gilvum]|uniref:VirB4-like conjugal transfer ATPase, CD1110 family n=1 Tax=Alkalibacterium gilvum TaxID=1130080 RepID=UPI003F92FE18
MLGTLKERLNRRKTKKTFRSSQDTLPYLNAYTDGVFQVRKERFSKVYSFHDINYQIAPVEQKQHYFEQYCHVLSSMDDRAEYQISIVNRDIDLEDLKEKIFLKARSDRFNSYRKEYNHMLAEKISEGNNDIESLKYVTITVEAKDYDRAKMILARNESNLIQGFQNLGTALVPLTLTERLALYEEIYRDEITHDFDLTETTKQGLNTKDQIAPMSFEFKRNQGRVGDQYFQSTLLTNFPSRIKDDILTELTELDMKMILTLNLQSIAPDKAIRLINRQITGMESDSMDLEQDSLQKGYLRTFIPHNLESGLKNAKAMLEQLQDDNEKLFTTNILITHFADSQDELDTHYEELSTIARRHICNLNILNFQQEDGLASTVPFGNNLLEIERTLTTQSTAIFMPFTSLEFNDDNGLYYGMNPLTNNLILLNRKNLHNASGFILGIPGSGKSFASKREITNVLLNTEDDIIVIDPENEYGQLVKNLGGELINVSTNNQHTINPMDITIIDDVDPARKKDEVDPFAFKTEFILSVCDVILGGNMEPKVKSIIDRCIRLTYKDFVQSDFDRKHLPTLEDFYNQVKAQEEPEAKDLATALEMYVLGYLDTFTGHTNIDVDSRFVCFNIKDLGNQLKTLGLLIVLDAVWNRIRKNRDSGKHTWIYFDEAHLLFKNDYAQDFLFQLYKQARKYGGIPTGMTQNIIDMLVSDKAVTMLANSQYIMLLNQAETDMREIKALYNLSDNQLNYVRNAKAGSGLIKYGGSILPFDDQFPRDTDLYQLMTTKLDEVHRD